MMGCVVEALEKNGCEQTGAENNYISSIQGLGEFGGGPMSGWMGTLNDWFTNQGFGAFTVADGTLGSGDEIRIMYTRNGYGADLGGSWDNNDKTVKDLAFSAGELSPEFHKDTHDYTLTVFAGLTNMVLDFLLVYVFPFGLLGAALATAFSQIVGALIPLVYFLRPNDSPLRLTRPRFDFRALGKACYNGSSEMVSNLSTSLVGVLYNVQLMAIAKENGVNAYGVLMYVSFIFMAFFFGYSIAVTPVVGYHYGAKNHAELKSLLKKSLTVTLITSLAMTASSILLANPIAHLFVGYDAELCDMTVNALRIYALSFLVCGFNIFGSAFFTGLNNGTASALISFLRTLVIQVAAVLLLPKLLDINGIWLAITVAEALTLIVTETLFLLGRKKYHYA